MRILIIGDIVGLLGCRIVRQNLKKIRQEKKIDFVIANGENSATRNGISIKSAEYLFESGVDVITGGNHSFKWHDSFEYMDKSSKIVRPANYPEGSPGKGFIKVDCLGHKICVMNISGVVFMEPVDCPFVTFDRLIDESSDCQIKILDFHAEATAEKRAMIFYADGRISALIGTHTHVQTSDEEIFPNGTAYITDAGMTGVSQSVIGVNPECSIKRMKGKIPLRFEYDTSGKGKMECVMVDVDETSGKSVLIERLRFEFD